MYSMQSCCLMIYRKISRYLSVIPLQKGMKRCIDASIMKVGKELEKLFHQTGMDCVEIELGMLVRRRKEEAYGGLVLEDEGARRFEGAVRPHRIFVCGKNLNRENTT